MRLVITENVTLDGVVEATDGWSPAGDDEEVDNSDSGRARLGHPPSSPVSCAWPKRRPSAPALS